MSGEAMEFQAVVGEDYRVTIPKWLRQDLGIEKGDIVILEIKRVVKRGRSGKKDIEV